MKRLLAIAEANKMKEETYMTILNPIRIEELKPEFSGEYWNHITTFKVEIIHGEVWTRLPKDHWLYPTLAFAKSLTPHGIYANPNDDSEIARVAGWAPDLQVLLFERK